MNLKSRLENLERRFAGPGNIVLTMPDGTERTIPLRRSGDTLEIFKRLIEDPQSPDAIAIRQATCISEPGHGHMLELAAAVFLPAEPIFEERQA
jgi:hypothetical protein